METYSNISSAAHNLSSQQNELRVLKQNLAHYRSIVQSNWTGGDSQALICAMDKLSARIDRASQQVANSASLMNTGVARKRVQDANNAIGV